VVVFAMFLAILLTACGNNTTPVTEYIVVTATAGPITSTPNPCAPENINAEVQKLHKYMREFDDTSSLAASRPKEQLGDAISKLQDIRRGAEDQLAPACLANLKTYEISHMNLVINTLIAYMGGADQTTVDQGITLARQQHDKYAVELASLLGLTMVPAQVSPPITDTPSPQ